MSKYLDMSEPTFRYKVALVGDAGVGKSTFIKRLLTGEFETKYIATLDVDVHPLYFQTQYGGIVFEVWDTAGQEQFSQLSEGYYVGSDAVIGMFDVTNKGTADRMLYWKTKAMSIVPHANYVACGNKVDCRKTKVKNLEKSEIRRLWGTYYDISAKSNYNFEKPFLDIARKLTGKKDLQFMPLPPHIPDEAVYPVELTA